MLWMQRLRLRVFALLVALVLLVFGVVGMLSVPVLPAVGVAITIAVTMVNTMTSRLAHITCTGCGCDLEHAPAGAHGIACAKCGTVNHPFNTGADNAEDVYAFDLSDDEDANEELTA